VIGRIGAQRAIALLVIGDAVLGGAFVAALVRPDAESPAPAQVIASTTTVLPPAAAPRSFDERDPVVAPAPAPASSSPPSSTTATSLPVTTAPITSHRAPSTGPSVADVPTTIVPTTVTTSPPPPPPPPPSSTPTGEDGV
jgi:hypothetical protein